MINSHSGANESLVEYIYISERLSLFDTVLLHLQQQKKESRYNVTYARTRRKWFQWPRTRITKWVTCESPCSVSRGQRSTDLALGAEVKEWDWKKCSLAHTFMHTSKMPRLDPPEPGPFLYLFFDIQVHSGKINAHSPEGVAELSGRVCVCVCLCMYQCPKAKCFYSVIKTHTHIEFHNHIELPTGDLSLVQHIKAPSSVSL